MHYSRHVITGPKLIPDTQALVLALTIPISCLQDPPCSQHTFLCTLLGRAGAAGGGVRRAAGVAGSRERHLPAAARRQLDHAAAGAPCSPPPLSVLDHTRQLFKLQSALHHTSIVGSQQPIALIMQARLSAMLPACTTSCSSRHASGVVCFTASKPRSVRGSAAAWICPMAACRERVGRS